MPELLFGCCLVLAFGSAVDCYYMILVSLLPAEELNPVARWVLKRWGIAGLVGCKCFLTGAVIAGLWWGFVLFPDPAVLIGLTVGSIMLLVAAWLWKSS